MLFAGAGHEDVVADQEGGGGLLPLGAQRVAVGPVCLQNVFSKPDVDIFPGKKRAVFPRTVLGPGHDENETVLKSRAPRPGLLEAQGPDQAGFAGSPGAYAQD